MNTSVKLSLALAAAALDTCTLLLTAAGSVGAHETTLTGIVLRAEDAERRATAACEVRTNDSSMKGLRPVFCVRVGPDVPQLISYACWITARENAFDMGNGML